MNRAERAAATTLHITRGLPASGKTTWARWFVAADPAHRARVNRDDLRWQMFGEHVLATRQEQVVTVAQHAQVRALLTAGTTVVVDDTNLRMRHARAFADIAAEVDAGFVVHDEFLDVTVDECVARDATRATHGLRSVGSVVIWGMHQMFLTRPLPPVVAVARGGPSPLRAVQPQPPELPPAWIVDIDGTLALRGDHDGHRDWYDWERVGEDSLNLPVYILVRALQGYGLDVVFMSGRDESCRAQTMTWLTQHFPEAKSLPLFMRPEGDVRKDAVVKAELFDAHVRGKWNVIGVLDDRNQVVDMWRAAGLMCAQVAPGDF